MANEVVIETLTAMAGNNPGQPVAWHGRRGRASIVFLPPTAPVDKQVRVILETVKSLDGTDKLDKAGRPIYRGRPAPDEVSHQWHQEGDMVARFEIRTDWLGITGPDMVTELERRPVAERFGGKLNRCTSRVGWGTDWASTVIETVTSEFTPIEREEVRDGHLTWKQVDEVAGPVTTTTAPITAHTQDSWASSWWDHRLGVAYDPAWTLRFKYTYIPVGNKYPTTYDHLPRWGELPGWLQAELEAAYPVCACGRARVDTAKAGGYPRCEQCRTAATCERCGKSAGQVAQVGPRAVCGACQPYEEGENLIHAHLSADRLATIAEQARTLATAAHYEGADGEILLRNLPGNLWHAESQGGFGHYYFGEGWVVASKLTPAALAILQLLATSAGDPLVEFTNWLTPIGRHKFDDGWSRPEENYYQATQTLGEAKTVGLYEHEVKELAEALAADKLAVGQLLTGLWVPEQKKAQARAIVEQAVRELRCPLCGQEFDDHGECHGELRLGDYAVELEVLAAGDTVRCRRPVEQQLRPSEQVPVGTISRWFVERDGAGWRLDYRSGSGSTFNRAAHRLTPGRWVHDKEGGWRACPDHDAYERVDFCRDYDGHGRECQVTTRLAEVRLPSGQLAAVVDVVGDDSRHDNLGAVRLATWERSVRLTEGETWWNGKPFDGQPTTRDLGRIRRPTAKAAPASTPAPHPPAPPAGKSHAGHPPTGGQTSAKAAPPPAGKPARSEVTPTDPATLNALRAWANKRGGR